MEGMETSQVLCMDVRATGTHKCLAQSKRPGVGYVAHRQRCFVDANLAWP